jgi:hypothetical protein
LGLTTRLGGDGRSARGREEGAQEGTRGGDGRGKKEEACVFPTNKHRVIKKTVPAITTMVTATHTVIPNLTSEELVKFMDVAVASKYGSDLMNFTRTITEEVHSTLDTFKTELQNTLPRQIRSVVQQVHGESRVNNQILNLAHLTRVAHPHQVTQAPFTRVTLLLRVTWVT